MNPQALRHLEDALTDVGFWRWWTARLPESFQLEFGGVQLLTATPDAGKAPSGVFALRFRQPWAVNFITRAGSALPPEWPSGRCAPCGTLRQPSPTGASRLSSARWLSRPALLRAEKLSPAHLTRGHFTFSDARAFRAIVGDAGRIETFHGSSFDVDEILAAPVHLAFWAGDAGIVVAADGIALVATEGEVPLARIPEASRRWWSYWRDYWRRKQRGEQPPIDYACEVTIPTDGQLDDTRDA